MNRLHGSSQGRIQYLGEWHTHPQKYAKPSSTDYKEWHKTCQYFKDQPVLFFIAGIHRDWIGVQKNKPCIYLIIQTMIIYIIRLIKHLTVN